MPFFRQRFPVVFASELFIPTLLFLFSITDPPSRFGIFQPLATTIPAQLVFYR